MITIDLEVVQVLFIILHLPTICRNMMQNAKKSLLEAGCSPTKCAMNITFVSDKKKIELVCIHNPPSKIDSIFSHFLTKNGTCLEVFTNSPCIWMEIQIWLDKKSEKTFFFKCYWQSSVRKTCNCTILDYAIS